MNTLKLMTGIAAIGILVSCKSSIQPVTTLGGENSEVAQTSEEPNASEGQDPSMEDANTVSMESTEDTTINPDEQETMDADGQDTMDADEQNTVVADEPNTMETAEPAVMEETEMDSPTSTSMDSTQTGGMENPQVEDYNGTTGANSNIQDEPMVSGENTQDFEAMYSALEMTDEQVDEFKAAMEQYSNEMNTDASGNEEGDIMEARDGILENILSQEQMVKYEEWKQDN